MQPKHGNEEHGKPEAHHTPFPIHIDKTMYMVEKNEMTGAELRALPTPNIGSDRDLYQVDPGGDDILIANGDVVQLNPGMHFDTAPHVNPGAGDGGR